MLLLGRRADDKVAHYRSLNIKLTNSTATSVTAVVGEIYVEKLTRRTLGQWESLGAILFSLASLVVVERAAVNEW